MKRYNDMTRDELLRELTRRDARTAQSCREQRKGEREKKVSPSGSSGRTLADEMLTRIMREQQVILESAPVGIFRIVDRKMVWSNRYTEELFYYPPGEMDGQTTRVFYPSREAFEEFGAAAYSMLIQGLEFQGVQEMMRRDGSLIWVRFHGKAVDPPDMSQGSIWILEDITERKEMQDALLRKQEELKSANEQLEQRVVARTAELEAAVREQESFSYSVSHDLRAPLRHINSFSSILISDYAEELSEQAQNYLGRIRAASGRMAVLIDDLLKLSRFTKCEVRLQQVDLSELAATIVRMFQETDPGRHAEFVIEPAITTQGDGTMLRQLLENLLGNAWKYTSQKKRPRIHFGKKSFRGKEAFFVKDNGAGFDMAYRTKIFRAFERLHGAEFEGAGVGLATVKRIVQRHGGTVWAEARVGQGATFYFTLQAMTCGS